MIGVIRPNDEMCEGYDECVECMRKSELKNGKWEMRGV